MLTLYFLLELAVLEAALIWIGPALQNNPHTAALANGLYIGLRLVAILSLSFLSVRVYRKSVYGALSLTGLLIFFDQVLFKSLWLWVNIRNHPADWQGVDPAGAIFGCVFSYIVFLPLILLLAFVGAWVGSRCATGRRSTPSARL